MRKFLTNFSGYVLIIILIISGCNLIGQDSFVPRQITMNPYTYLSTHGTAIETSDIYFKLYHSTDSLSFTEIDTFQTPPYTQLLERHPDLYDDSLHYIGVTAYRISNNTESVMSNVASKVFPKQLPSPPENAQIAE